MQFFYKIIYQKNINFILRNIGRLLKPLLSQNLYLPPAGKFVLKTNSGALNIHTNQTSYLTQILYWKGYKEFEYSGIFESLTKKIDVFIDIGSNIGYYSLLAAKSNPKIKVYAFEPALGPKYYLKKNIESNKFEDNIEYFDLALSNQSGEIEFFEVANVKYKYLDYNLAGEGNAGTKRTSRNFKKNYVKAITLKNFIESKKLQKIDLIKIDTEGTEIDILKSGYLEIINYKPIIICETLFNTIEFELETLFNELHYDFYNHTPYGLQKVNKITRKLDDGIRNCFFVPKSKLSLIKPYLADT